MRVLITRPLDDAVALAEKLKARGIDSLTNSLLAVRYEDGPPVDLDRAQALLFTSANGVRAFVRRNDDRTLDVLTVGDATARAAKEAGFARVQSASGDVAALAELVLHTRDPGNGALLHVAGSRVAGDLEGMLTREGFTYRRVVLYGAETATDLAPATVAAFHDGDIAGVLLYSPRTATTFAALAERAGIGRAVGAVTAYCLSAAVAEKARALNWQSIRISPRPEEAALLDMVAEDGDGRQ